MDSIPRASDNIIIDGNIDITSAIAQNRVELEVRNASELHIGGSLLRNAIPNRYGILDCQNTSTVYYDGNGSAGQKKVTENYSNRTDTFNYQYVIIDNASATFPQLLMEGEANIISEDTI